MKNVKTVTNFEFVGENKVWIRGFVMTSLNYVHNMTELE
jgi:hypothetical protein